MLLSTIARWLLQYTVYIKISLGTAILLFVFFGSVCLSTVRLCVRFFSLPHLSRIFWVFPFLFIHTGSIWFSLSPYFHDIFLHVRTISFCFWSLFLKLCVFLLLYNTSYIPFPLPFVCTFPSYSTRTFLHYRLLYFL